MDMGDARGHWEGDTLVVETTNFTRAQRLPQRQRRRAEVDRALHALSPDAARVAVTVDDATTWTRPWTFAMPLTDQ